ncbi:MAG: hypothetical protein ACE5R4_12045 [Armatimonadota bacterium]
MKRCWFDALVIAALLVIAGALGLGLLRQRDGKLLMAEGIRLEEADDWAQALISYRQASVLLPRDPELRVRLGGALAMTGHYSEAMPYLQHPDPRLARELRAAAWLNLALAHDSLQPGSAAAVEAVEAAREAWPDAPARTYARGRACLKAGNTGEARRFLWQAAQLGVPEAEELLRSLEEAGQPAE